MNITPTKNKTLYVKYDNERVESLETRARTIIVQHITMEIAKMLSNKTGLYVINCFTRLIDGARERAYSMYRITFNRRPYRPGAADRSIATSLSPFLYHVFFTKT